MCYGVRKFDVIVDGITRQDLTEEEVEHLFRKGVLDRGSRCRESGKGDWSTIDERLPILKYVHRDRAPSRTVALPEESPLLISSVLSGLATDERAKPALTSSLKAGWICFGLAALVAWIFPPAFFFYSVALIMAIVAMCTHQVNRGLILLLSSFVGMGTSALLSLMLAVGIFAAAAKPMVDRAEQNRLELQAAERKMQQQLERMQLQLTENLNRSLPRSSETRRTHTQPPLPLTGSGHDSSLNRLTRNRTTPDQLSERELLKEIATIEATIRRIRNSGRDVNLSTTEYLQNLRAALDAKR